MVAGNYRGQGIIRAIPSLLVVFIMYSITKLVFDDIECVPVGPIALKDTLSRCCLQTFF